MGGLNKRRISTEFLTFEWYPHNYLTLFTRISTITKFHILYFLLHTSVINNPSIDPPATHRVRPAAAGVGVHCRAEEGAGPAQGPGDVALSDGLPDHGRVALRAATAPAASAGTRREAQILS